MLAVALILGAVIGLSLGALGGGGSILTVPALVYALSEKASAATTGSLIIVGITAAVGSIGHARAGRVRWRAGIGFGFAGIASSYLGTALNKHVNADVLLLAFSLLVVIAASGMWRRAASNPPTPAPAPEPALVGVTGTAPLPRAELAPHDASVPTGGSGDVGPSTGRAGRSVWLRVVVAGLVVGFLTGFFGVGGGFVIVPALTLALGFAMPEAVGTSLVIIAINSAAALAERAGQHQSVDWHVVAPFAAAAVVGSLLGKNVADRASGPVLTRSFAILLVAVAIYTATRSIVGLS